MPSNGESARAQFQEVARTLIGSPGSGNALLPIDVHAACDDAAAEPIRLLNAAFLNRLAGDPAAAPEGVEDPDVEEIAEFYRSAAELVLDEIFAVADNDPQFAEELQDMYSWCTASGPEANAEDVSERCWKLFFPEAAGMRADRKAAGDAIRKRRTVKILEQNPDPMDHPARQILFTSNVLLTLPSPSQPESDWVIPPDLVEPVRRLADEEQKYYYDHPIQMGVEIDSNEVLYGLRGLNETLRVEKERGVVAEDEVMTCLLSVSVTHDGLQEIAKPYLVHQLGCMESLDHVQVCVLTEADTRKLLEEVLVPAAGRLPGGQAQLENMRQVFGVDGAYGRHYSVLKAVAALWHVLVDDEVKATFKIDLDQVFPQENLIGEAGGSALELFQTPLWGARGEDADGRPVELGMIAGALVNEKDIGRSLFTPDVTWSGGDLTADQYVFFSKLPQAVSTDAEMMTRYGGEDLDGSNRCLQRVHVTGGTNGILVDALMRHRPFTPTFFGRAEDQAYLLSVVNRDEPGLGYAHRPGLIMRHDKEAFAQEAIASATIGREVGDYERILYFSAYAEALGDRDRIKNWADPFTGCFISRTPCTTAFLRFALRISEYIANGQFKEAVDFARNGATRIRQACAFVRGPDSALARQYRDERAGWDLYYDTLEALRRDLAEEDPAARELRTRTREIVEACMVYRPRNARA